METDIGNPIDYNPANDPFKSDEKNEDSTPIDDQRLQEQEQYYFQPPEMMYPPPQHFPLEKTDFISGIDKTTWIVAFAVFLLGFFMGKTMQPVILRYAWVSSECTNVSIHWNNFTCNVTIHHLGWIYRYYKRVSSIFYKTRGCWWLTFVLWNHICIFTWFKKQNKERTRQNNGQNYFPHFVLKLTNI